MIPSPLRALSKNRKGNVGASAPRSLYLFCPELRAGSNPFSIIRNKTFGFRNN